jgi:hypothetical protein
MTKTTLLAAALALAACVPAETDPVQEMRDALPKPQAVQVGTPQDEGTAGALTVRRDALGDSPMLQSEYAVTSYYLALAVNGGTAWTLALLQFIVAHPPTAFDATSATWGPWVDEAGLNRWQLVVERQGQDYAYVLAAQNGVDPGPFVPLLSGVARPGADRDRGSGTFTVDFDAQDQLAHGPLWTKEDFGRLTVTYDNTRSVSVDAVFTGARNDDPDAPHAMNAAYAFDDAASGGQLQVAFENLDTTEVVSLRTRWSAGGAGRADARYDGPDGMGGRVDYFASECWAGRAASFVEVYDSKYPGIPELADESACSPFGTAAYADVVLP